MSMISDKIFMNWKKNKTMKVRIRLIKTDQNK